MPKRDFRFHGERNPMEDCKSMAGGTEFHLRDSTLGRRLLMSPFLFVFFLLSETWIGF